MTNLVSDIPFGTTSTFNTIVEIPRGERHKYEYDESLNVFRLNRILFPAMSYPGNYGFIPQTIADDGDPIDVLIVKSGQIERGTMVECYPIGALHMEDDGKLDIKVICMPTFHHLRSSFTKIDDFDEFSVEQIHHFFQHYKDMENKSVILKGWIPLDETKGLIEKGHVEWYLHEPE